MSKQTAEIIKAAQSSEGAGWWRSSLEEAFLKTDEGKDIQEVVRKWNDGEITFIKMLQLTTVKFLAAQTED